MRREGIISIENLDCKENPFAVDFWGLNEGSGSPCKNEREVEERVKQLTERHSKEYNIKLIDKRIKQRTLF